MQQSKTREAHLNEFKNDLPQIKRQLQPLKIYTDWDADTTNYDQKRRLFNLRFDHKPAAILMCISKEDVTAAIDLAKKYHLELRVKSGGHDHEGESSATDCILINFEEMLDFRLDEMKDERTGETLKVARIGAGWRFKDIVAQHLDPNKISIPHGTCGTVGLAGFTLGGGWGPWTRRHGMCCDRLVGATVVLGDGQSVDLSINDTDSAKKDLLWALRGGGGFGFGIVTEYVINYFDQPAETRKFKVIFNESPALKVLKKWEHLIDYDQSEQLLGTNLQIMGVPLNKDIPVEDSIQQCTFYGYLDGDDQAVIDSVSGWFEGFKSFQLWIEFADYYHIYDYRNGEMGPPHRKDKDSSDPYGFSSWHRITLETFEQAIDSVDLLDGQGFGLIPPDADEAAPHRITSRMVRKGGFDEEGRKQLINSLRSDMIKSEAIAAGIFQYVTLGSISGAYYKRYQDNPDLAYESSFPYHERPYIVQYQVWWNTEEKYRQAGILHHVRQFTNQALDWIDVSRTRSFPQVRGSFISFKDASVPTRNYFLENYDKLVDIKKRCVKDEDNLFQSRKTII